MPAPQRSANTSGRGARTTAETRLVARLRAGENEAYRVLLRREGPWMRGLARRIVGSESDAHDVVQDALLSLYQGIGRYDGRAALRTWLYRIVVNAALMQLRSRRRRREEVSSQVSDGVAQRLSPTGADDWLAASQTVGVLHAQLGQVPARSRRVFELSVFEGVSMGEVAARLGISRSCARVHLHRARHKLREALDAPVEPRRGNYTAAATPRATRPRNHR